MLLTLAHSPDPDDAFMWWPITGKIRPLPVQDARGVWKYEQLSPPAIDTGGFKFVAAPADIEVLNRAAVRDEPRYDITALSVRCWADVRDRFALTRCGASFGDGFGPKLVCRESSTLHTIDDVVAANSTIAIPGEKTTAFLMLRLAMKDAVGPKGNAGTLPLAPPSGRGEKTLTLPSPGGRKGERTHPQPPPSGRGFRELPFDQIIPAVSRGEVDLGLVIHEGQLTFADAGLRLILDVGAWWKQRTGLKLPLGVNAVRRDLDTRFGRGTVQRVAEILRASVKYAMDRREESTAYTLPFAEANALRAAAEKPTLERIDRYCRMYVRDETLDLGPAGLEAIGRLLREGAAAGLCAEPGEIEAV